MLQKKNILVLLIISFVVLFNLPSIGNTSNGVDHVKVWKLANKIPINRCGFGGQFPEHKMDDLQRLIDGTRGSKHRHDGSHNPLIVLAKPKVQALKLPVQVVLNAVIIHNILDMADPGPQGTNGWKSTSKRRIEAEKFQKKILNGKGIITPPKWSHKLGKEVGSSMLLRIKTSLMKILPCDKMFNKVSVVVKRVPYAGPVIYVTYEGITFTHRYKKGINLEEEIPKVVSSVIGLGFAAAGAKVGVVVCTPLEAIPVAGPVLHVIGTITVSLGCGFAGEYITKQSIQYIKITYI